VGLAVRVGHARVRGPVRVEQAVLVRAAADVHALPVDAGVERVGLRVAALEVRLARDDALSVRAARRLDVSRRRDALTIGEAARLRALARLTSVEGRAVAVALTRRRARAVEAVLAGVAGRVVEALHAFSARALVGDAVRAIRVRVAAGTATLFDAVVSRGVAPTEGVVLLTERVRRSRVSALLREQLAVLRRGRATVDRLLALDEGALSRGLRDLELPRDAHADARAAAEAGRWHRDAREAGGAVAGRHARFPLARLTPSRRIVAAALAPTHARRDSDEHGREAAKRQGPRPHGTPR